ncbi:MAG TPA: LamG domain-containing protein, partial [Candidatus Brocadiaceae bacterium]|nr:LamG domain-containing protein [Candidatus Brocadiaceae bacterium]
NDKEKAEKEKAEQEKKDKQERLTQERLAKEERERAQQEKAEQEKLTRVPQTFPTEAAFPPTASAEPIWVLKTTETKITKDPDSSDFFNNQMNIQGTSASGSTTMRDGAHQSSHSWSAVPPGRLTPGQKLQFTISVGVQGPQNSIPGHLGAGTAIYVYFQPGGGPYGMGDVNVGYVTNTPDRPKQSKVLNWTVPSGYEGKKMFIIYSADTNPHMTGQIIYTFEYAKLDPNAQSATTSEGQKPVESKRPKVVLTPSSIAMMKLGEKVRIQASVLDAKPGDNPVRYTWSGAGEASDDMVSIVANIPGKFNVSVSADGPNRNLGSASLEYEVEPITVNVEKTSPATDTITVGGKAQFKATAVSGAGRTVSGLNFQWQPHPEIEFEPFEKSATTTATFRKPGTYSIYVQALMKDGERYTTIGESNGVTITVVNPSWKMEFNPPEPLIGQEVRAKISPDTGKEGSEPDMKEMNFRWQLPANAKQRWTSQDDREITFYLTDDKSASISCLASTKYENENLGGAGKTIRAKAYNITIKGPRPRQEFWMWKSDTQLGGGPSGGMKKVENQYAVDQEILFSSKIEPAPEKPVSYNWTASPGDCTFNSNGGSDTSITCRSTGSYTVMVTAKMDGMEIGSAAANVSVSISQDDITRSNKAKEAYEKLQKAKELVSQGKLDEGIQMADEASKLDPNNTEAATLANKWKDEKEKDKAEGPLQQKNAQVQQLVNEGYELEQQGRLAEGIEKYKSALRLGPNPKLTERIAILERKIAEQTSSTPTGTPAMSGTQPVDLSIVGGKKAAPRVVKGVSIDDGSWIRFKSTDENRRSLDIQVPVPTRAAAVAVVSNLDDATYLEQGKIIARITVVKDTGDEVLDIQAGVHSSEWNYGVGPKHAWVKDADIGDSRFLVVLPLARPGLVNAMRIDYVETNAPKWYGHAPGFCLRGLSLVADTQGMTLTPAGSSPVSTSASTGVATGQATASGEQQVFSNDNIDGVGDDPTVATTFRTDKSWLVTYVMTYHYNGGRGQTPGAIGLRHQDGIMYGPWQASGRPNQGSQTNLYWECRPNVVINPGVYTVIDSHPASWSWNSRSGGGIAIIKGTPQRSSQSPAKAPSSGQAGDARSVKAATREDSGSKVGGQVKPVIATPPQSPSTLPTEVASPQVGRSESGVIDSSSGELEGTWVVPTDVPSLKREIYFSRNGKSYTGKIVIEEGFGSNSFQIGEVAVRVTRVDANVYKGEYLSIVDGIKTWRSHTFAVKDDVFYVTDLVGQDDMDPTICRRKKSEAIPEVISEAINVRVKKTSPSAVEEQIFSNNNIDVVWDGPAAATIFRTDRSWLITYVLTYHYNGGRGQTPGAIGLRHQDGTMYGPWQASGRPNQGNQTNLYWECWPNVVIKPGVYTVIDSHPASWSWNSQSGGGITIIKGTPSVTVTSSTPGGLIGKWSFDGDAKDSSGNGNDGIIKGATFVDGKFGKALSFDGVDDSVSIGANLIKKDNTPFSIVSWFKIPSGGGNSYYDTIYSSGNCDGSYGFHSYAGGDKRLYFDKECVVGLISANTQYFLDVWHQGIVVYNGNSARIYLDGVPDSNWVAVANQGGAEANDYIGSIASSYYFKGLIDEVRIYNRVLSETEIQAEWNAGASPPTAQ